MENYGIKSLLSKHFEQHLSMYISLIIFIIGLIIMVVLASALIHDKKENKENKENVTKDTVAVKVFINENDTIIPKLSSEINDLKEMIQKMQEDTLCVTITKGYK